MKCPHCDRVIATLHVGPISRIIAEVCEDYGITREELLSERRTKKLALPRMIAMARSIDETDATYSTVGRVFKRDPTTVRYAHEKYGNRSYAYVVDTRPQLRQMGQG